MKEAQELREPTEQYYAQPLEVRSFVVYSQRQFDIKLRPSLPPAYVVRREGNVLTRVCPSICLSTGGGYPYPIMLCNISQNAMGQLGGGTLPGPAGGGGTLAGRGGTLAVRGGTLAGRGGTLARRGTLAGGGGYPGQGGGGTQLGQHREYLLHGGRYASCVHAGGLSWFVMFLHETVKFSKCSISYNHATPFVPVVWQFIL